MLLTYQAEVAVGGVSQLATHHSRLTHDSRLTIHDFTPIPILFVNQHTVPVFIDVVNAFAASGVRPTLFTGYIEAGRKDLSDTVRIVKSVRYNRASSFQRLLSWLSFSVLYCLYLLFCKKPSHIVVVSNPPLTPVLTGFIARLRKIPYSIILYDLYPDALEQAGFLSPTSRISRLWRRLNLHVFEHAHRIFTLSDSMKESARRYLKDDKTDIVTIANWADADYIRPMPKADNNFVKRHHLLGKRVVMYSGNMGLTHDLESLIGMAEMLQDQKSLIFILIGEGGKKRLLQNMVEEKKIENVLFLPYQDATNFPLAMAAADVGVVTLGAGAEGISVPSKTYINMAAGLCLLGIAPEASELSRLINAYQAGLTYQPGDVHGLACGVRRLLSDQALLDTYKENALKASRNFTPENAHRYVREIRTPA